jgi:hypothetical protein
MWKEEVLVDCFKIISQHMVGRTEENYKRPVKTAGFWISK